ncbi:MAG TPA: LuxR C-terminal-related transcriptional regulator, partial [Thermomicrobiales bacterium]|nr:LuxR C-terminal-related transcriptional regulator [Thermomicrobiales bacterium]
IPPRPPGLLARERLVEEIERNLVDSRLILVAAPAGYGKTTILTEWAHTTSRAVAWLNVEPEQNDPERLLRYLATSWSVADPKVLRSAVGLLLESSLPALDLVARAMANYALLAEIPVAFVLDDLHLIRDPASCDLLRFLLEHLPPEFRFIVAARSQPGMLAPRLRVRQRLFAIGPTELAFSTEETTSFFVRSRGQALSDDEIGRVQEQCEGWAAGLQLMAQSSATRSGAPGAFTGDHREIREYLTAEVLGELDDATRQFLEQISMLDQFCAPLCDAVTARTNSREILDRIERANLFLQPLDAERAWYRLHPLLRDALGRDLQMSPELDEPDLHIRAGHWFLQQKMIDEAFRHAVAAANPGLVAQIAESYVVMKLESGEYRTVQRWVESVPDDWYAACPELNILRIAFLVFSGDVEGSIAIMDELDTRIHLDSGETAVRLGAKMATARCAIACFLDQVPQAEAYAARALRDLDVDDVTFRANTHHALADTYRRHSRWDDAMSHYRHVLDLAHDPAFPVRSAHVYGAVADLELRQGHLHEAASLWQKDIAAIQRQWSWGKLPVPIIGWAYIRYGELLYEWNALDDATRELERGLERAELGGDARAMIAGYLLMSRLRLCAGDLPAAADYVNRAEALSAHAPYPEWLSKLDRTRALVYVHQGDAAAAREWWMRTRSRTELAARPENQEGYLGLTHLMVVFGDDDDRADVRQILSNLIVQAKSEGRLGVEVEALALLALSHQADGNDADALIAIERALRLAEPEGPVRLFLDLGAPLAELLHKAERRRVLSSYGVRLRAAGMRVIPRPAHGLVEPLSERELEILRLAAAGLTNRETGDRLFISAETVKSHLGNVYAKLGVHRRTEAAARARELGLLR